MKIRKFIGALLLVFLSAFMCAPAAYAVIVQDPNGREIELPEFDDTKGHWAEKTINQWQYYDIVKGVGEKRFEPNKPVTRRDFAVIIDRLFKFYDIGVNSFSDLELDQYYTLPMLRLHAARVMYGDGKNIRPHDHITREEAVTMLCRAFGIETKNITAGFTDDDEIAYWAYPAVATFKSYGYINGFNGKFNPKGKLTRAELVMMIDNLIEAYYRDSGAYTNIYTGNGFISTSGVVLRNSQITGNIYIVQGARGGQVILDNSNINGKVIVNAESSQVLLQGNSVVSEIDIKAKNVVINNADLASIITVGEGISGANLDKVPERLILKAGASAVVDGVEFKNDGSSDISYKESVLIKEIAEKKGYVVGGPKVILENVSITIDNNVTLAIKLDNTGDSDIEEIGIIYNKSDEVPTLDDYDVQKKFKGNEADYASFTMNVEGQDAGEVWTYRAYAKNKNGKIGYSSPKSIKAYQFDITGNVINTKMIYNSDGTLGGVEKTFEVFINGENVPTIARVVALSNLENMIDEPYTETDCAINKSYVSSDYKKLSYTAKILFSVQQDGSIYPHKFYGYRVTFMSGETIERFPTFTDYTKLPQDVNKIETGTASFHTSQILNINGNVFEEGSGIPVELGVVLLERDIDDPAPTSVNPADGWKRYPYYAGYGKWNSPYSVQIDVSGNPNIIYYYAAYVKTTTRTTYGSIKRIISHSAPVYQSIKKITVGTQKNNAIVELNVLSSLPLYLTAADGIASFVKASDGTPVEAYHNKPLSAAGAQHDGEVLKITFVGLEPNEDYNVTLRLGNAQGVTNVNFVLSTK